MQTRKQGDWTCTKCYSMVFASKNACFKCGTKKNTQSYHPEDWICPNCKFVVFGSKNQCNCGQLKPTNFEQVTSTSTINKNPADWVCDKCGNLVFGSKIKCRCGNENKSLMKPGDWICDVCGDLVFSSKPNCRKCGSAKPTGLTQNQDNQCVICLNKQSFYLPSGCGHYCMCEQCAMHPDLRQCPICRKDFTKFELVRVFS